MASGVSGKETPQMLLVVSVFVCVCVCVCLMVILVGAQAHLVSEKFCGWKQSKKKKREN